MPDKTKKVVKILQACIIAVIFLALVAGNVACIALRDFITTYFGGYGLNTENIDYEKGDDVVRYVEAEGIVLLKNDNALPLGKGKVNVFGWGATDEGFVYSGSGSGATKNTEARVTFLQGLREAGLEYNEGLMQKYTSFCRSRDTDKYFNLIEPQPSDVEKWISETGAEGYSSTALVVLSRLGREQGDLTRKQDKTYSDADATRTYLEISTEEEGLMRLVRSRFEKVIVIVNTCNAMELGFLDEAETKADAALYIGATGQSGTVSVGKVLTGETAPSGRLADTYAYDLSTAASYANSANGLEVDNEAGSIHKYASAEEYYVDYAEGIYVGYKWYETADSAGFWESDYAAEKWGVHGYGDVVQYPFGYGLSYTTFDWEVKNISPADGSELGADDKIEIEVRVTNTGNAAGKDVVEVYYEPPYYDGGIEKASKNLVAFRKTPLISPGESTTVTLSFQVRDMRSYDYAGLNVTGEAGYCLEDGIYNVYLSKDAHTYVNKFAYTMSETLLLKNDEKTGNPVENHFTGESATDGVSIDGTSTNQNISYLTRVDFEGTFPQVTAARVKPEMTTTVPEPTLPAYEASGEKLPLFKDGEPDLGLMMELGSDYDSPKWEIVLNSMAQSELVALMERGGYGTEAVASIAKPKFIDLDGPAGISDSVMTTNNAKTTYYPIETVIACSWSTEVAKTYGSAIGSEAAQLGVAGWYAPAVNIHRSPFDGRNYEYYSEDGFLAGKLAAETVSGAIDMGLYCYVKHFALNETENKREGLYTWLTEQTLREIYLRPFEIAVKEGGANAIMSSFNRIGAVWSGASSALMTQVLRNEWGFRGTVVTDAYLLDRTYMNADTGLRAGSDLWLNCVGAELGESIHADKKSPTALSLMKNAAHNILYTYCNTVQRAETFVSKGANTVAANWLWALGAIDVVCLVGIGCWTYFLFFRKEKEEQTDE